jgi:hypothetical protein
LKETVQLLSSYDLRTSDELREHKPQLRDKCQLVEHLASYSGFCCLQPGCSYCTRHFREMKKHVASTHKVKAARHKESPLWRECQLQTYFTGRGRIDYFVVVNRLEKKGKFRHVRDSNQATETEKVLFEELEKDCRGVKDDVEEQAALSRILGILGRQGCLPPQPICFPLPRAGLTRFTMWSV